MKRLAELRGEIEHIAAGLLSPTLRAKLEAAEVVHTRLVSDKSASNTPRAADFLAGLAGLIGDVRMIPDGGQRPGCLIY